MSFGLRCRLSGDTERHNTDIDPACRMSVSERDICHSVADSTCPRKTGRLIKPNHWGERDRRISTRGHMRGGGEKEREREQNQTSKLERRGTRSTHQVDGHLPTEFDRSMSLLLDCCPAHLFDVGGTASLEPITHTDWMLDLSLRRTSLGQREH